MRVEIDLFSGRPNPVWELDESEVDTVRRTLAALPDAVGEAPELFSGLGYRGFRLTDRAKCVVVYHDLIVIQDGVSRAVKADAGRDLERFLVGTARNHLDPGDYEAVVSQV